MSDTEGSNMASPQSAMESPYSSPSQQVPQLAYSMTELRCTDNKYLHPEKGKCFLRIVEQPQDHFRFRYRSEMVGTHGCLLGESYGSSKTKTHPTVELVNYKGRAVIRCRLAQDKTPDEHPHKLLEDDQDRDVSYEVPEHGSYKVGFAGMGIIHTAKKDVPSLLFKKYSENLRSQQLNLKDLRIHCENEAKSINLNIVRLRFSAHDIVTDEEICPPVLSKPIHNMKSAATNDLRISRISRSCGRANGGEDVFLLVEKVNKKNIMVRLFELNEAGEETWQATGHFLQSDVHHQYAIVFRTPPYKDVNTSVDRKVYIELMRPSDGRTSEPKEFTYKASPSFRGLGKRKKGNSPYSSIGSSDGSLRSNGDVPATVLCMNVPQNIDHNIEEPINDVKMCTIPQIPTLPTGACGGGGGGGGGLGEALYGLRSAAPQQQALPDPPDLQLNSAEFQRILKDCQENLNITPDETELTRLDWSQYILSFPDSLHSLPGENNPSNGMEFIRSMLVSDSGRGNKSQSKASASQSQGISTIDTKPNVVDQTKCSAEYTAFYKAEDGSEVKKLVKELCEMIRDKTGVKKQIVRNKLERLFQLRLSNGDTFLHMTLCSKQPSLDYIVKLIHSMKMTHLLNITNHLSQTIFHLAVAHDMPKVVTFLASKGCDPMIEDVDGNNVIHYAVIYQACLEPLLDALKDNKVLHDLNAFNDEKQTALHLAVMNKSVSSIRKLLECGASYLSRDCSGRTALHLAAYDDCLPALAALLDHVLPSEIDAVDGRGYTALQIVCDGEVRENTLKMVKLLLEKQADPLCHEEGSSSAWMLARRAGAVRGVMRAHRPALPLPPPHADDVKSEPEDEYESADEGESARGVCLEALSSYVEAVSAALEARGGWQRLARRRGLAPLLGWLARTPRPARTLLTHIKECGDDLSSKELAVILEELGEIDAAKIIRTYID